MNKGPQYLAYKTTKHYKRRKNPTRSVAIVKETGKYCL